MTRHKLVDPDAELDPSDPDYEAAMDFRFRHEQPSLLAREVKALTERVAQLERRMSKASRDKERDFIFETVGKALSKLDFMTYSGTWDADRKEGYRKGSVVAHDGASWVAVTDAGKGARPGKSPEWRMTAKGNSR